MSTDEQIAMLLGWFFEGKDRNGRPKVRRPHPLYMDLPATSQRFSLPRFTEDLTALVKEIEAQGLWWYVSTDGPLRVGVGSKTRPGSLGKWANNYPTACEALANVFVSYLNPTEWCLACAGKGFWHCDCHGEILCTHAHGKVICKACNGTGRAAIHHAKAEGR